MRRGLHRPLVCQSCTPPGRRPSAFTFTPMNNLDPPVSLVNQLIPLTAGVWSVERTGADRCLCHYEKKQTNHNNTTPGIFHSTRLSFSGLCFHILTALDLHRAVCSMDWTIVGGQDHLSVMCMAFVQRIYYQPVFFADRKDGGRG